MDADDRAFRAAARQALAAGVRPEELSFVAIDAPSLFPDLPTSDVNPGIRVPRSFDALLRDAICHRSADRFSLLYDVLWRTVHGARYLLSNAADPSVARLETYARNVRRDIHKMHAFLRFRLQRIDDRDVFVAWFEPQHFILRRALPFFADRFAQMDWLIATPIGTASWQGGELSHGPPGPPPPNGGDSVLDDVWIAYYRTTFNPARLRVKAMVGEMPRHYWRNMPEAAAIPAMIADAHARTTGMEALPPDEAPAFASAIAARSGAPAPQAHPDLPLEAIRIELQSCRRCPLHAPATQAVPGEGPANARVMIVGEQPGDQEDLRGRPFVGPAGEVLDRALEEAGLDRADLYLTNVVKHFKFEPRGKRRLHKRPNAGETTACRWWMGREIAALRPTLIVALGATAAVALSGRPVSVTAERGRASFAEGPGYITVHPSFLLRIPDARERAHQYDLFVTDLREVAAIAHGAPVR